TDPRGSRCFLGNSCKVSAAKRPQIVQVRPTVAGTRRAPHPGRRQWVTGELVQSTGERQGAPWTGRQSITGQHRDTQDKQPCTHSFTPKGNLKRPVYLTVMFFGLWEEAGVPVVLLPFAEIHRSWSEATNQSQKECLSSVNHACVCAAHIPSLHSEYHCSRLPPSRSQQGKELWREDCSTAESKVEGPVRVVGTYLPWSLGDRQGTRQSITD
ncbi:hypothetical protein ILYODFUR_012876, partial [Ilyodon furcidens]